mgnify:FL=1
MDIQLISACGAYCGVCEWKERMNCPGCVAAKGDMFWGSCKIAKCAMRKELQHCGLCLELPCDLLRQAFEDPEHGDNGERLENLKTWAGGGDVYKELTRRARLR